MLQYLGLDNIIVQAIGEVNANKIGRKTVGTGIPIISEAEVLASEPDILVILPWHFKEFFITKLWTTMENGTSLLIPLPEPELVSVANNELFYTDLTTGESVSVSWVK